jgi:ABC-type glycerol-3-phosphate transport system substrate-binding protein
VAGAGDVFGAWFVKTYGAEAWRELLVEQEIFFAGNRDEQAKNLVRGPHHIAIPSPGTANMQPYFDAGLDVNVMEMGSGSDTAFLTIAYSTTGIISKSPHPNAARLFVNWLLSRDIQEKLKRFAHNSRRLDVSPAFAEKYPKPGVSYYMPQAESAVADRQTAIDLAKEVRPN